MVDERSASTISLRDGDRPQPLVGPLAGGASNQEHLLGTTIFVRNEQLAITGGASHPTKIYITGYKPRSGDSESTWVGSLDPPR